jgi:hypothetical protein
MALDQTARVQTASEPSQAEYDAIHDTMMASARGRWFLGEYARRNRTADTTAVLAAIDRIGAHLRGEALPPHAPEYLHLGLMAMAGLVAAVESDMSALSTGHETESSAKPRVSRVVSTLRDLGDCIQVMLDNFKPEAAEAPPAPRPPANLMVVETPEPAPVTLVTPEPVVARVEAAVPPSVELTVPAPQAEAPASQQQVVEAAPVAATPAPQLAALAAVAQAMEAASAEAASAEAASVQAASANTISEIAPAPALASAPTAMDAAIVELEDNEPTIATAGVEAGAIELFEPAAPIAPASVDAVMSPPAPAPAPAVTAPTSAGSVQVALTAAAMSAGAIVLDAATDFEPIAFRAPEEAAADARAFQALNPVTAAALPLQDLLPEDHPLAELRSLSKAELVALFT